MPSLSRVEAVQRAETVRVQAYDIDLDLSAAEDSGTFGCTTTIRFSAVPGSSAFVELKPVQLEAVSLNGEPRNPADLVENRFPLEDLGEDNELVVRATMEYSHTGEGLHRFVDAEDGGTYLYAQAFLDDAQRFFACFDQPDLKAPVTMRISAPLGWEVAANASGTQVAPGRWEFEPTPPLPPYLVSVLAGPYHVRRDEHDGVPLALYCRRALAPHLDKDADELFALTKACLDRYHALFGFRYPFGKYDQAFVPEFNAGAMENPGLVTLRDEYLFRSAVTDVERELRAVTIAHEMAHMWFGDLVTMRWWDDLWLNESFAEYMGYRVTAEATRFQNAWTGFAVGRKAWGYAADQRPSTHPVAPESVVDTAHALLNFDGISYAKGASVLRQLVAWLGDETFLAGLSAYFNAHAYDNATLADLLEALGTAAGRDLHEWADVWLRQPQVNTLIPEVEVASDGGYDVVHIRQTAAPEYPVLRPHRLGLGVYAGGTLRHALTVDVRGERTAVPELTGVTAGDLLLLNDGDLTFAKVRFDPESQASLARTLPELADPLARALVWAAVIDAVRDADQPAHDFLALVEAGLPVETDLSVVRDLMRFVTNRAVDASFAPGGLFGRFLPPDEVADAEARVAAAFRAALHSPPHAAHGSAGRPGLALSAARGFVASAGPSDVDELRAWLTDGAPAGLAMDAELRWAVLARLSVLGALTEGEIDWEVERDHTAAGAVHAARCRSSRPDPEAKERAWCAVMNDAALSNRLVAATAEGFWHPGQRELTASYVDRYFAELPDFARRRTPNMVVQVGAATFPRYAVVAETVARAEALLADADHPMVRRVVGDCTDELRRAVAGVAAR